MTNKLVGMVRSVLTVNSRIEWGWGCTYPCHNIRPHHIFVFV